MNAYNILHNMHVHVHLQDECSIRMLHNVHTKQYQSLYRLLTRQYTAHNHHLSYL